MNINDKICRPEEIISDTVWELYKLVQCSDIRYMWYCSENHEVLCHIDKVHLGSDKTEYDYCSLGEIPCSKNEWVQVNLSNIENGEKKQYRIRIKVNALFECKQTAEELLKERALRCASQADIKKAEFKEEKLYPNSLEIGIPVNNYTVQLAKSRFKERLSNTSYAIEYFFNGLHRNHITCKKNSNNGNTRVEFVIMSDIVPGEFLRGQMDFYETTAHARMNYNSICSKICRKSEHIDELYRLLNYINAHIFTDHPITSGKLRGIYTTFAARLFLDEDCDFNITVSATVGKELWSDSVTLSFFSEYLPKLLEFLSPYIFGVLQGEMAADDAIWQIKSLALCELDKMQ